MVHQAHPRENYRSGHMMTTHRYYRKREPLRTFEAQFCIFRKNLEKSYAEGGRVADGAGRHRPRRVEDEHHHRGVIHLEGRPDGVARGRDEAEPGVVGGVAEHQHQVLALPPGGVQRGADGGRAGALPLVFGADGARGQGPRRASG